MSKEFSYFVRKNKIKTKWKNKRRRNIYTIHWIHHFSIDKHILEQFSVQHIHLSKIIRNVLHIYNWTALVQLQNPKKK